MDEDDEISQQLADQILEKWGQPQPQKLPSSLRSLVSRMYDGIEAHILNGYTFADLSRMIADQGILIPSATLRKYHAENRELQDLQSRVGGAILSPSRSGGKRMTKAKAQLKSVTQIAIKPSTTANSQVSLPETASALEPVVEAVVEPVAEPVQETLEETNPDRSPTSQPPPQPTSQPTSQPSVQPTQRRGLTNGRSMPDVSSQYTKNHLTGNP